MLAEPCINVKKETEKTKEEMLVAEILLYMAEKTGNINLGGANTNILQTTEAEEIIEHKISEKSLDSSSQVPLGSCSGRKNYKLKSKSTLFLICQVKIIQYKDIQTIDFAFMYCRHQFS